MLIDSIVHGVQVPDIKGRKRKFLGKSIWKESHPSVIAHENDFLFETRDKLIDEVVLVDLKGSKVAGEINEGCQASGREAFDSLHRRGWRIGSELKQFSLSLLLKLVEDWESVLIIIRTLVGFVENCEFMFESVDDDYDSFGKDWRLAIAIGF